MTSKFMPNLFGIWPNGGKPNIQEELPVESKTSEEGGRIRPVNERIDCFIMLNKVGAYSYMS